MNFNLTEEHLMIKDAARNFAETELLSWLFSNTKFKNE